MKGKNKILQITMPFLELFDETLDINSTENYELSVQLSSDGLSFCVLDTIRNKFVLIRSSEPEENKYFNADSLIEIIGNDDFLTKKYRKVRIVMPSSKFTLVPAPLYDPAKKDAYFSFNHLNADNEVILTNKITDPETYLIFSVPAPLTDLIKKIFPQAQPFHHIKTLLRHISHKRKSVNGNYIHIHIERDFFQIIIFNHDSLRFCNTFNYRNISDILYYVLNVFKNLDIKQEESIYLSGQTAKFDDISSSFSIYIRNVLFSSPAGNFTFSYVFNELDLHRFLNLFTLTNCE
jgi:hypothetical protein